MKWPHFRFSRVRECALFSFLEWFSVYDCDWHCAAQMRGNFDLRGTVKWRFVCIKNVVLTKQTSVVFKCLSDSERRMTLKFCFWPYYNAVHGNLDLRQFVSIFYIEQIEQSGESYRNDSLHFETAFSLLSPSPSLRSLLILHRYNWTGTFVKTATHYLRGWDWRGSEEAHLRSSLEIRGIER